MKIILQTVPVWMLMAIAGYGQNPAAMAIRTQIEQGASQAPSKAPAPADDWQQAKKLTLLSKIPQSPRGPKECLAPADLKEDTTGYLECWPTIVAQIVGPNDVLLTLGSPKAPPILLTGYPTKGLVRGEKVRLVGPVQVLGTKSQPMPGGNKTVRMVRLASQADSAGQPAAAEAGSSAAAMRTWTDSKGKFTVSARFVDFKSGQVRLEREDGKTISVAMSQLSLKDQKWVHDELARQSQRKDQPADAATSKKASSAKSPANLPNKPAAKYPARRTPNR